MNKSIKLLGLLFVFSLNAMALDVDTKLTVRVLKTSQSKKTILTNQGRDDGLIIGDHAKFFVSEGVVARAVVIELSKNRSVWSVYRLINPDLISNNEVMNIKITPKVKLTKDPLSVIASDATSSETLDGQLEDKEFSVYSDLIDDTKAPAATPTIVVHKEELGQDIGERSLEFWLQLGFQSYSSEVTGTASNSDYSGSEFLNNALLGAEYYLGDMFSLFGHLQYTQESLLSFDGAVTDSSLLEFGAGGNLYLFSDPHKSDRLISYFTFGVGVGKITDSFSGGELAPGSQDTIEVTGSTLSFLAGIGFKYHLSNGFGMRFVLDVYKREDTFDEDSSGIATEEWKRERFGPRLGIGISYRL